MSANILTLASASEDCRGLFGAGGNSAMRQDSTGISLPAQTRAQLQTDMNN